MNKYDRLLGLLLFILFHASSAFAQDKTLVLGSQVENTLSPNETHRYSLTILELTLVSFRVQALSESLDPQLAIYDGSGELVISNDDFDFPDSLDALIQAFVIPKSDRYTVAVSGFKGTSGPYRLQLLPGYDVPVNADSKLLLDDWKVVNRRAEVRQAGSDRLAVEVDGLATTAVMLGARFRQELDTYFEVQFDNVSSADDWQVGLAFRYARPDLHSRVLLNKRGFWRMERVDEGDIVVVRNWGTHPAIVPGESKFRLGIMASGQHFDIVYNGQIVGMISDKQTAATGNVGIAMRTADAVGSRLSFAVTDATMTIPTRVDDRPIVPDQLLARSYHVMDNVLARQQLIPVDGEFKLLLPQSSVRRRLAGVTSYLVGSGLRFAEFAIGAKVSYEMGKEANGGCGIFFHYQDEERYQLAYVTAEGDYGVSLRDGDVFAPGVYVNRPAPKQHEHDMLLVVYEGTIHYYVDNQHIGQLATETSPGNVGIAVVNFATVNTSCVFEDFWVLSLDG